MAKHCEVCKNSIGLLTFKFQLKDGVVCRKCMRESGIANLPNSATYLTNDVVALLSDRRKLVDQFTQTKTISESIVHYLDVDESNKLFRIGVEVYKYDELLSFELLEDGTSIASGGIGRAIAGGLLFGPAGAIVGGVTGKKKSVCNSLKIHITLKNSFKDSVDIVFFSADVKTNSSVYKNAKKNAQNCVSALQIIADDNSKNASVLSSASAADEILKFKQLMDSGIITPEEFEAKKQKLLNI